MRRQERNDIIKTLVKKKVVSVDDGIQYYKVSDLIGDDDEVDIDYDDLAQSLGLDISECTIIDNILLEMLDYNILDSLCFQDGYYG